MRLSRRGRRAVLIVSAALGLLAIAGMLAFDPIVRRVAIERARDEGVELTLGHVRAGWGSAELSRFSFELVGVSRLVGEVDRLGVDLDGLDPVAIDVRGARIDAWGSPSQLGLELGSWALVNPNLRNLPLRVSELSLSWRPTAAAEPLLSIERGVVAAAGGGGRGSLDADLRIAGVDLGPLAASWSGEAIGLAAALGTSNAATLQLTSRLVEAPQLVAVLAPTDLEALLAPWGGVAPAPGVRVSGKVVVALAPAGALTGTAELELTGVHLPLPPEVSAILPPAATTEVSSRVRVRLDPPELTLQDLKLTHGALVLAGQGRIAEQDGAPHAWLTFAGELSCAALARSAVGGRVGGALGKLVGGVAGRAVGGVVRFVVTVEANPLRLQDAEVKQTATIGCDLRPGNLLPQLLPREPLPGSNDPHRGDSGR